MLRLNRFDYVSPDSIEEAVVTMDRYGDDAALMAGGTDVLVNIKHRLMTPKILVGIRHLSQISGIHQRQDGWLDIGAGVTLAQLESSPAVRSRYRALADAAHLVSTPQVRTLATIGGNVCLDTRCNYYNQSQDWRRAIGYCMKKDSEICRVAPGGDRCWAVASADTVPVLVALGAEVSLLSTSGRRRFSVESLYVDDGLIPMTLRPGEIVIAVHLPQEHDLQCVYEKFRIRQSFDFPLVGIAISLRRTADGTVTDARIVTTAVASFPERAHRAEEALRNRSLDQDAIAAAGQAVFKQAKPMDNTAGTIFHRKRMARVLLERGLARLAMGHSDIVHTSPSGQSHP